MTVKITNVPFAVSPGKYDPSPEGSGTIILQSILDLPKTNSYYVGFVTDDLVASNSGEPSLASSAPSGENFFYQIELFNKEVGVDRAVTVSERGLGIIFPSGSNLHLYRHIVLENQKIGESGLSKSSPFDRTVFDSGDYLAVSSYTPSDYRHMCAGSDSVLCTTTPFQPEPVEIDVSGILGRKSDRLTSLSGKDIGDIIIKSDSTFISDIALKTTTPVKWATSKFDLTHKNSLIIANEIRCKETRVRPTKPEKGSIIFNSVTNKFEGWNGTEWLPFQHETNQSSTDIEW